MRICIATGIYRNKRGTQVNFHVANLFDGNTVVLSETSGAPCPWNRPHFAWSERDNALTSLRDRAGLYGGYVANLYRHRMKRVPRGETRRRIEEFLLDQKVDAVLAEFGSVAIRVAPVVNDMGIPMFTYFRGADASSHLREPFRIEAYRRLMPQLTGVFSVAQFLLDNLAHEGIRHDNSFVVPSGVDTDLFMPSVKMPKSCLAVGRLVEKKRPDITIRAFCAATRNTPDARLEIIGDGPLLEACNSMVARECAEAKVTLHGAQPHDFVRERLAACEVFLQHSVTASNGNTEGLPTAIQEAMSTGTIIVSTRHAGIPEFVVEGETGFLVDEGDETGFTDAISHALSLSDTARADMAKRARDFARAHFDNRTLVRFVEEKIAELSAAR